MAFSRMQMNTLKKIKVDNYAAMSLAKCLYKHGISFSFFPTLLIEWSQRHWVVVEDVKSRKRARIIIMFIPIKLEIRELLKGSQQLSCQWLSSSPMSIISHVFNIYHTASLHLHSWRKGIFMHVIIQVAFIYIFCSISYFSYNYWLKSMLLGISINISLQYCTICLFYILLDIPINEHLEHFQFFPL